MAEPVWHQGTADADTIVGGEGMDDWMVYIGSDAGVDVDLGPGGVNKGGHAEGDILQSIENIYGSMHNDVITGDIGANMLMGNEGSDELNGGGGDDVLHGNSGRDELNGDTGNDMLYGGQDDDVVMGGAGNDVLSGGDGADVIDGGAGMDLARYASSAAGVTVDLGAGTASGGQATGDELSNVEGVIGSHHADMLTLGDDGGMLFGYMGNDMLMGGEGNDTLKAGMGNDTVMADKGNDMLYGGKGADTLDVGGGNNTAMGGEGVDTFVLWTGIAGGVTNHLSDFSGDMIQFGAAATGEKTMLTSEQVEAILDGQMPEDGRYVYEHGGVKFTSPVALEASNFYAETGPKPPKPTNVVDLTEGHDVWPGGGDDNDGEDHVRGRGGNDTIYGGFKADFLEGGAGNDMLYGEMGNDTLHGGSGVDVLRGDVGNDHLYGGEGNDRMAAENDGNPDTAALMGGDGHDYLDGGKGNDILEGGKGRDVLKGGDGKDMLYAADAGGTTADDSEGPLVDMLYGGAGDDTLEGAAGNDMLDGGLGNDMLDGGLGNDMFMATKGDIVVGGEGMDTVSYKGTSDKVTVNLGDPSATGAQNVTAVEHAIGSENSDMLTGSGEANKLTGGGGNDTLTGGEGADTLTGGGGEDTFVWDDADVGDRITDFSLGSDKIKLADDAERTLFLETATVRDWHDPAESPDDGKADGIEVVFGEDAAAEVMIFEGLPTTTTIEDFTLLGG